MQFICYMCKFLKFTTIYKLFNFLLRWNTIDFIINYRKMDANRNSLKNRPFCLWISNMPKSKREIFIDKIHNIIYFFCLHAYIFKHFSF